MQAVRILPDLQFSLLCEDLRQESNGNLIAVGIAHQIVLPQVPITVFRMVILNRWVSGFGQFTECVRIVGPDQTTVLRKYEGKFELNQQVINATKATMVTSFEFKAPGLYNIEVLVDDVLKLRYAIPVVVMPPPAAPPGA